ncbi:hypothetical protein N7507_001773 [Penicillium longicatenatum]|nr:hypothetical protein N7507_001773 [Penicillium longicatenatum]
MTVTVKYLGLYDFVASEGAAIAFAVLFFAPMVMHAFQLFRTKTWFFIPFLTGLILSRLYDSTSIGPIYSHLGGPRPIGCQHLYGIWPYNSRHERRKTHYHPTNMAHKDICLRRYHIIVVQFGGAGMLANTSAASSGSKIMKTDSVLCFLPLHHVLFHFRLVKNGSATIYTVPWKRHVMVSYASGTLISVRSVFRLVEFSEFTGSTEGPISKYEWMSFVFDAVMVLIAGVIFNWIHPSELVPYLPNQRDFSDMEMLT